MEIFLAIVVASAVIFFGALISIGNDRQRKAIDQLREQTTLWAVQDLKLKRERLSRDVKVEDPQNWLNNIAFVICGHDLNLQVVESFAEPQTLSCISADGQCKILFTPLSPSDIRYIKKGKQNRLGKFAVSNPLLSLPKDVTSRELSPLNSGILFDLEMQLVWKELTGQKLESTSRFWMYEYS
jgi:hypothetical protein